MTASGFRSALATFCVIWLLPCLAAAEVTKVTITSRTVIANGEAFNYKLYTVTGTAPAGTIFVRARVSMIGGQGNPAGGGQAYVVDDFALNAVPEPTAALLGLAALPCILRRARRR